MMQPVLGRTVFATGRMFALLAGFALVLGFALNAGAQAPTEAQRARARELYTQGQRHFDAGRFAEAQSAFESAYEQVPSPTVLLAIASAQERQGRQTEAAGTLRRYLRTRADAPDRASIEERIVQLDPNGLTDPSQGTIHVDSTPAGASIALDGQPTGQVAPADIRTSVGAHEVTLTMEGFAPSSETVTVEPTATAQLSLTLPASEAAQPSSEEDVFGSEPTEPVAETPSAPPPPPGPSTGVWVTTAIAGVTLVAGTVFGFLALSAQSDFDSNPTTETADRGDTFALIADISFGVALAAGVTAIVLYATDRPSEAPAASQASARRSSDDLHLTVAPFGGPNGGGAALQVTF